MLKTDNLVQRINIKFGYQNRHNMYKEGNNAPEQLHYSTSEMQEGLQEQYPGDYSFLQHTLMSACFARKKNNLIDKMYILFIILQASYETEALFTKYLTKLLEVNFSLFGTTGITIPVSKAIKASLLKTRNSLMSTLSPKIHLN